LIALICTAPDSFFANESESKVEQSGATGRFATMKKVPSLIPRISERQSEAIREKLSDYVATLLEKNAARLSKYEKPATDRDARTE
jgi:hypothetical protein